MEQLSEKEAEACVLGFYYALKTEDLDKMLALCAEDMSLTWGPFTFKGKEDVKRWAAELWHHFKEIKFARFELHVLRENRVESMFDLEATNLNGPRGRLTGAGAFRFKDGKIQDIQINVMGGFIFYKEKDIQ